MGEHEIKVAAQQREISGEHTDSPQNGRKSLPTTLQTIQNLLIKKNFGNSMQRE